MIIRIKYKQNIERERERERQIERGRYIGGWGVNATGKSDSVGSCMPAGQRGTNISSCSCSCVPAQSQPAPAFFLCLAQGLPVSST